jgi:hypothetical protein
MDGTGLGKGAFLVNPATLEPWPLQKVSQGSKKFRVRFWERECPLDCQEAPLDTIERELRFLVFFTQPDKNLLSFVINLAHHAHLVCFLRIIFLINAYAVNPENPWLGWLAQTQQRVAEIVRDMNVLHSELVHRS